MPDWFGALLVIGIIVIAGTRFSGPSQHQELTSDPSKLGFNSNVQQWQWTGAGVGFLTGLMRATEPWQGAELFINVVEALALAVCAALLARAARQWLNTRRP